MLRAIGQLKLAVAVCVAAALWSCAPEVSEENRNNEGTTPSLSQSQSQDGTTPETGAGYHGVVVEEVNEGSAPEKAGLQVGDVVLAWERFPVSLEEPGAVQPETKPASGQIESAFDWLWVELEQAPRGPLKLIGERDGKRKVFDVGMGLWDVTVRPRLSPDLLEPYLEGRELVSSGNLESGIALWQDIAERAQKQKDELLQCWLQLRIGEIWSEAKAWEKAHAAHRSALKVAREPGAQVAVWDATGQAYKLQNDLAQAATSYRSALEIRRATWGECLGAAASLYNLGIVAWFRGQVEGAEKDLQRALQIREHLAPGSLATAVSLNSMGIAARQRGELKRAEEHLQRALRIQEEVAPGSLDVARSLNNVGGLAFAQGDLARAEHFYQSSLEIREKRIPDSLTVVAESLSNMGVVLWARGELERAEASFQQAFEIFKDLRPGSPMLAQSLNNLGMVALARGELEQAEEYLQQALRIKEKLAPESLEVAHSLNNRGKVAQALGELERAEEYFQRALGIKEELAPGSPDVASTLACLGVLANQRGELGQAVEYHQRALEIWENLTSGNLYKALSLNDLGSVMRGRGDLERAVELYQRALEIQEELAPGSLALAETLNDFGAAVRDRGELQQAAIYSRRSITALENQIGKLGGTLDLQGRFRAEHRKIYRNAVEIQLELEQPQQAFDILERYRARSFLAMLTERDLDFSADLSEDLDRKHRSVGPRYDQVLRTMQQQPEKSEELADELKGLLRERDELIGRIRAQSPQLADLQYPQPLKLEQVQQILDPGTVLLTYSVGEERTDLFVVTPEEGLVQVELLPSGEEKLRQQVDRFRDAIGAATVSESQFFTRVEETGKSLYRLLIEPVEGAIAAGDRLLILPDGPLHTLPFGALIRPAGPEGAGQYLVEWKPFHTALSATVYAQLRQRPPQPSRGEGSAPMQLAAFGDPRFPRTLTPAECLCGSEGAPATAPESITDVYLRAAVENRSFNWCPLCFSRQEVSGVVEQFPGRARVFLGEEATEEQVKALDRRTPFVHFATHAHFDDRVPLNSAVVLSIPEALPAERDNGLLQVWEIFERVRLDAELVVLSGCETGVGELQGGEGLIGLTRAFQYAGARSVIATLWRVDDAATAELMVRFYRHLKDGKAKDEALRAAQIELIRGRIPVRTAAGKPMEKDASAPFYWAAFQLYGARQ